MMKKASWFILLFLVFQACKNISTAQPFFGGVSAGLNVSQVDGDGFSGYNKAGLYAGFFVNTMIREKMGAQFEIRYSEKGSSKKSSAENPEIYRIELQYIELPFMLFFTHFHPFTGETGLSFGYLFAGREKNELGIIPPEATIPFNKWEIAGFAGARYHLNRSISAHVRLSYSFARIRKHAGGGTWYFNRGQYNNLISMGVNYHF